ncbi:MAG: VWA domain-containing protein [Bacteroidetes bacterium]|nr:VWA domain-containing protein [Bacteroidota bacterium]
MQDTKQSFFFRMVRKRRVRFISFLVIFISCFSSVYAQKKNTPPPQTTRILFIFDASFSMFGRWQSGIKMDIAKDMFTGFLDSLKDVPNLEVAFRAYGHQSRLNPPVGYPPDNSPRDCKDTKLEVPFETVNASIPKIRNRLKSISPTGTTPIAYTLEQCAEDFTPCANCRNIVILITDGIEECDGDPCAVSQALQKKGIILKPFIIGIGMDESFIKSFGCIGKYYDVSQEANFTKVLNVVISQALNSTTAQVNLLDKAGKPTETDVNMTFYDEFSGAIRYNYMHTINHRGNPDTVILDPITTYKMIVHTIPPQEKTNISLEAGKHTVIALDAPQGFLSLKINGINNYKSLQTIVRKKGTPTTLHVQEFNQLEKYIVGKYDLEILTLPRIVLEDVDISQSKTTTIEIPQAGMVSISKPSEGPASIYLEEKNKVVWVCNLKDNMIQENIVLQPGNYRIEYRPKSAKESIYTVEKKFKVESGSTVQVRVF